MGSSQDALLLASLLAFQESQATFSEVKLSFDFEEETIWCNFNPKERPCFTLSQLHDLKQSFDALYQLVSGYQADLPFKWFVSSSEVPGIYNYGGDLKLFVECVRDRNRDKLVDYAERCIDLVYTTSRSFNLPITTIALLQGDALGGGFEAALACDFIIAEKHVKIGLPESSFNLFPGMGAYSFLHRRIGAQKAKAMIFSGRVYSAVELLEWGVIDQVVETGEGKAATLKFIRQRQANYNVYQSMRLVNQLVSPVSRQELMDVVQVWVDATLNLSNSNLIKMEKLLALQQKKWQRIQHQRLALQQPNESSLKAAVS